PRRSADPQESPCRSRLRPTLQRWPGANPLWPTPPWPGDSVDGLRPPSLTTGPTITSLVSILLMLDFIMTASGWTNPCPRKPGAAQPEIVSGWTIAIAFNTDGNSRANPYNEKVIHHPDYEPFWAAA